MRTWREVREDLMKAPKQHFSLLLQGEEAPTYFYRPLESNFNAFDDVLPEEMELICEDEIRMLLCGYQSENIRIQFNSQNNRPQNLTANPSFDPYIRSTIDRYLDIVTDLYTIRVQGHEIRSNLLRSRIARVIVSKITHRLDDLLNPILIESFVQRQGSADEGFHDSEYGLNGLSRMTGAIKSTLHCYADIVSAIYEKNLCGGEIIDLLEDKYQKAVRDRQELQLLVKEAWKIFFEIAGTWISYGQLEDANRDFFVWPTKGIKSVDVELLLKEDGKTENGYLLVVELCPKLIRPYMTAIFQCGQNTNSSIQSSLSEWSNLENPSRFIQKVSGLTSELSAVVLKQMRNEGRLDEFIQCFFTTMLNSPWLARISSALVAKDLPNRMYNEVADGVLKSLTHQTLHHDIGYFPLMANFRFSKDSSNVFDALIRCQYISQSRSSMKTRSESQPTLADRLTITVTMPEGLQRIMTPDLIYTYSLIFRLQMRIMLAAITLDEKKSELGRTGMRIGIQDASLRQPLQLLNQMSQYLMKFRLQLFNAVRGALRLFSERLSKASHVEEVSRLQRDCLTHIFKEGKLTEEHIYIVEDLIGLILSFAADCTFDQLIESYNLWLESVDSARFLNNEFTAFA